MKKTNTISCILIKRLSFLFIVFLFHFSIHAQPQSKFNTLELVSLKKTDTISIPTFEYIHTASKNQMNTNFLLKSASNSYQAGNHLIKAGKELKANN